MLEQIFLKVLDMSRAGGLIILVVFLARVCLKRFPKYISYMLWSVVLFRLLCPFTPEFRISLVPNLKPVFYEYTSEKEAVSTEWPAESDMPYTGGIPVTGQEAGQTIPMQSHPDEFVETPKASWQELFVLFGKYVWVSGIGAMFLYCVISALKIRRKVAPSIPLRENIYITDERISPFVIGLLSPRIYLPDGLSDREQEYIILHEKYHIRRLDHIVKPVAFAALCVHWFNPLVWISFILFSKDMEMSCDEAVIKKLGEDIRADYSASLLALSTWRPILGGIPVDFGEGNTKDRVKNLASYKKRKKGVLAVLVAGVVILILCLASHRKTWLPDSGSPENGTDGVQSGETPQEPDGPNPNEPASEEPALDAPDEPDPLVVSVDIEAHYVTHKGDPNNLYYIDENNVLWGCGSNICGQLGQGTQDYDFHSDMAKIAENVVHVDFSQNDFVIFLTQDHKLYGMGNAGCGALQQYEEFDYARHTNKGHDTVTTPILLMEDVVYACCGREDVVCLKEDGTVWTWGTVYLEGGQISPNVYYLQTPKKILENAVLVTGGWFNHAALLQDGTVWTWGYNTSGNCGVADTDPIAVPTMVAEDVIMVWTDLAVDGYPQPGAKEAAMAWTGQLQYNMAYEDIAEFGDVYPRLLNNTVIQKTDGSYWVCGENVGTEAKTVHGQEGSYIAVYTHEFCLCE